MRAGRLDRAVRVEKPGRDDADVRLAPGGELERLEPARVREHVGVQDHRVLVRREFLESAIDSRREAPVSLEEEKLGVGIGATKSLLVLRGAAVVHDQHAHPLPVRRLPDRAGGGQRQVGIAVAGDHDRDPPTPAPVPAPGGASLARQPV